MTLYTFTIFTFLVWLMVCLGRYDSLLCYFDFSVQHQVHPAEQLIIWINTQFVSGAAQFTLKRLLQSAGKGHTEAIGQAVSTFQYVAFCYFRQSDYE
uniref:Uncharacterized protein n=1 Tax=Electrophorus electricus TaxID=8005 RepID=A0AAY5F2M1_ELEEL